MYGPEARRDLPPEHCAFRRRSLLRAMVSLALASSLSAAMAGCSSANGGPTTGNALQPAYNAIYGIAPLKPGDQLGLLDVPLQNRSSQPVFIQSISPDGQGIGPVIRVVQMSLGPLTAGRNATYGGAYTTDPPVALVGNSCHVQRLVPVRDYRIAAGQMARVWVVIKAVRTGRFHVSAHTVDYVQNGKSLQQVITVGYSGTVSSDAAYIPPPPIQTRCLGSTGARLLPSYR